MRTLIMLLVLATIAACGGGGGGSSRSTPAPTTTNRPPTLVSNAPGAHAATEDAAFRYIFASLFTDPDGNTLRYTLPGNKPAWLSVSGTTLVGTPTNANVTAAPVRVTLTASDGSLSVSYAFTISVANVNDPPTLANALVDPTGIAGRAFRYTFAENTFNDVDAGDRLTYTATLMDGNALPSGLTFTGATRTFGGTPGAGSYMITVTATDTSKATATGTFTLTIKSPLQPNTLDVLDASPSSQVDINPMNFGGVNLVHLARSGATVTVTGDCPEFAHTTINRTVADLSSSDYNRLQSHWVRCDFAQNNIYTITARHEVGGSTVTASQIISTGTGSAGTITARVTDSRTAAQVDTLFFDYFQNDYGASLNSGDLSLVFLDRDEFFTSIDAFIFELLQENWNNLVKPIPNYGVHNERVAYSSSAPDGAPATLSGLVSYPDISGNMGFTPKDKMIVLLHGSGSTPSEPVMATVDDVWYTAANLIATQGYLVLTPDNYGRGLTEGPNNARNPETYLLANRTARNAYDLIKLVQADRKYNPYRNTVTGGTARRKDVTLVGYSQGGHTVMGLFQLLGTHDPDIPVQEVWAGGAPHDLYKSFKGVAEDLHPDSSKCVEGNGYCQLVDMPTALRFAKPLIEGLVKYADVGELQTSQLLTTNSMGEVTAFASDLANGFLADQARYDKLKLTLQLNSFTNIQSAQAVFGAGTTVHLFHSQHDRVVPYANTADLARVLKTAGLTVMLEEDRCNGRGEGEEDEGAWDEVYESFNDRVGLVHAFCGLSMLDAVLIDLKGTD